MHASRYAAFRKGRLLLLFLAIASLLPAVSWAKLPGLSLDEFEGRAARPSEKADNPAGRSVTRVEIVQGDRAGVDSLRPRDVPRATRARTNAIARAPILPGAAPVVPRVAVWRILGGGNTVLKRLEQLSEKAQPIQEYRTTLILERIGTPEAKSLVEKWAADKARPDRGNATEAALERMN